MPIRSGDIGWTLFAGPIDIELKNLTQISQKHPQLEAIKKSIQEQGLINTFDVGWVVGEKELTILRGNQRYEALKQLGINLVSCHLKIIITKDKEDIAIALSKILPNARIVTGQTHKLAREPIEWRQNEENEKGSK